MPQSLWTTTSLPPHPSPLLSLFLWWSLTCLDSVSLLLLPIMITGTPSSSFLCCSFYSSYSSIVLLFLFDCSIVPLPLFYCFVFVFVFAPQPSLLLSLSLLWSLIFLDSVSLLLLLTVITGLYQALGKVILSSFSSLFCFSSLSPFSLLISLFSLCFFFSSSFLLTGLSKK